MSFSRNQQPELRQYLDLAWKAECRSSGGDISERCRGARCHQCAYCQWYEEVLFGATGERSTTACNAGRDYDLFMRDLEIIHGDSIKWQMKAHKGDANRLRHELGSLGQKYDLDEGYFRGVAMRMLSLDHLPALLDLTRPQLILILGEVRRYCRRRLAREQPVPIDDNVPF